MTGPPGDKGPTGLEGDQGPLGAEGEPGANGAHGLRGQACWDVNRNGVGDPGEDENGDEVVDLEDCPPVPRDLVCSRSQTYAYGGGRRMDLSADVEELDEGGRRRQAYWRCEPRPYASDPKNDVYFEEFFALSNPWKLGDTGQANAYLGARDMLTFEVDGDGEIMAQRGQLPGVMSATDTYSLELLFGEVDIGTHAQFEIGTLAEDDTPNLTLRGSGADWRVSCVGAHGTDDRMFVVDPSDPFRHVAFDYLGGEVLVRIDGVLLGTLDCGPIEYAQLMTRLYSNDDDGLGLVEIDGIVLRTAR